MADTTLPEPAASSYDVDGNLYAVHRLFCGACLCAEPVEDPLSIAINAVGTPALEIAEAIMKIMDEIEEAQPPYSPGWQRDLRLCRILADTVVVAVADEFSPEVVKAIAEAGKKTTAYLIKDLYLHDEA